MVVHRKRILEKPKSESEIRENYAEFASDDVFTIGSIVLTDVTSGTQVKGREYKEGVGSRKESENQFVNCLFFEFRFQL